MRLAPDGPPDHFLELATTEMTFESKNTRTTSRWNYVFVLTIAFAGVIATILSENGISLFSEIMIACSGLIVVPLMFYNKVPLRIQVCTDDNTLTVDYIDRFKWTITSKKVPLSKTQIQTSHNEDLETYSLPTTNEYYSIYLINPDFGELKVSGQDFENIHQVFKVFSDLRAQTARRLRRKRNRN
jgi:hypothetical protein